MKINETETFARTSFKYIVKYKIKWLINIVYRFYCFTMDNITMILMI